MGEQGKHAVAPASEAESGSNRPRPRSMQTSQQPQATRAERWSLRRMLASPGMRVRAGILAKPLSRRDGARQAAQWIMPHPRATAPFIP